MSHKSVLKKSTQVHFSVIKRVSVIKRLYGLSSFESPKPFLDLHPVNGENFNSSIQLFHIVLDFEVQFEL